MSKMVRVNFYKIKIPLVFINNKSDTTMLFIHGINSSSDIFKPLWLGIKKFNIICINMPGNKYYLEQKGIISFDYWIKSVNFLIKKIRSKNLIIFAHSMGGAIANFLTYDKKNTKLILLNPLHPFIDKSFSYSLLEKIYKPSNLVNKFIGNAVDNLTDRFKKFERLNRNFSKSSIYSKLIEECVLDKNFLDKLNLEYLKNKSKMLLLISEKDYVINTNNLLTFALDNKINYKIVGIGHSPIAEFSSEIINIINNNFQARIKKIMLFSPLKLSKKEK
ncbi:esterase/lipase [Mycoplasmopsis meleagridis]|nr:esterase/lipase [Mycoplasmopsis meleagridis]